MDTPSPTSDPFHGLDPRSLMAAAAMPTDGDADTIRLTPRDLPTLEEIAAAFPDLEVLDLIGHGGMSAVFRARQPRLDRIVALKVLPKSLAATPGFPERFTREGRVLARLSHPHIVTVHDFGESGGFCYLIMEHVDGVNLRQAMRAGRFTPEQALGIIPALCDALQSAHSQGVLHRDIKPENILLDSKGRVKIADFGIAKILGEDSGDSMLLTQSGAKLGTAPYMAPEQIEKPATVDHRADIYSLGVVFYEMLTGELPLGRFAAPSEKAAVSGGMDEVVFRALEKERERRQQSAGEFKTQVENIAALPPRAQQALAQRFQSFEYKSKRTLLGLPLLHVTSGIDPATGHKRVARGFFAFGDIAVGVVACGGYARGLVAFGGLAVGGIAMGAVSLGLVSWGAVAVALVFAMGGFSVAPLATGGVAVGWQAMGAFVMAWHGHGSTVFAQHGLGGDVHAPHVLRAFAEMPAALQWLSLASKWISMGAFLWLPLTLPTMLVPWWARRQLALGEDGAQPPAAQDRSARVFWLIPAAFALGGVVWWMLYAWTISGRADLARLIIPSVVGGFGVLLFALSLPLWLRLVPMNSFYGVRLPSTLASGERWHDVNARFGKHLFLWSITVIIAGLAGFYQLPRHEDAYAWAAITLTLVGVAASVMSTLWWMRQHPVDAPAWKQNRIMHWAGQVMVAVVIAMFIKSFIAAPYKIAGGFETGVTKGSHWMVSRLDTGFASGDLVVFQHESGQYWIARVVTVQPKGLLLKRGGAAEEFFMPWDKIAGKMLFAHFSPPVSVTSKGSSSGASSGRHDWKKGAPVVNATAHAPKEQPRLLYLRAVPNGQPWSPEIYDAEGRPVPLSKETLKIIGETTTGQSSPEPDACWLQAWIQHPDFDESSHIYAMVDSSGPREIAFQNDHTSGFIPAGGPVHSVVLRLGKSLQLPRTVALRFACSGGVWDDPKRLDKTPDFNLSTDDWFNGGVGEDANRQCFVTWLKRRVNRQIQCVACLTDGARYAGMLSTTSSATGEQIIERAVFGVRLDEVDHFELRARDIRQVVFKDVVVPPLQKAEVVVVAHGKSSSLPWLSGLTIGGLMKMAGLSTALPTTDNPGKIHWFHEGRDHEIKINASTYRETVSPGDKITILE